MIKAIIFDYDGVIVDSFTTIFEVYKIICKELNGKCPESLKKFKKIYGYQAKEAKKNMGIKPEDFKRADEIFKREIIKKEPELFMGIKETLENLNKEYKLFLITSNFKEEVRQKSEKFGLIEYFDKILGNEGDGIYKKSEQINNIIETFNLKKNEILYIGDRDIDFDISREAGLDHVLLVNYGWGYNNKKIKQDIIIEKPFDIINAIKIIK